MLTPTPQRIASKVANRSSRMSPTCGLRSNCANIHASAAPAARKRRPCNPVYAKIEEQEPDGDRARAEDPGEHAVLDDAPGAGREMLRVGGRCGVPRRGLGHVVLPRRDAPRVRAAVAPSCLGAAEDATGRAGARVPCPPAAARRS